MSERCGETKGPHCTKGKPCGNSASRWIKFATNNNKMRMRPAASQSMVYFPVTRRGDQMPYYPEELVFLDRQLAEALRELRAAIQRFCERLGRGEKSNN